MEVGRISPLSYDVTAPERDPSSQRGVIVGLLTLIATWIVVVVGGWLALGFVANPRMVNVGLPLLIVLVTVGAAVFASRRCTPHALRHAALVMLAISTGASLLAFQTLVNVKATLPQVKWELDRVPVPDGFRLVAEETSGDRMCRRGCPRVDRVYAVPAGDEDPVRTLILAMFAHGWSRTSDVEEANATTAERDGIFAHLSENVDEGTVRLTATRQS